MEKKLNIINELDVKESIFYLRSKKTNRYSIQDSYNENFENGLLNKLEAPENVELAYKDLYYANEKGLVISYREFNNLIVIARKGILEKKYPNKKFKDLAKNVKISLERESAREVMNNYSINDTTKVIYSPELTTLKKNYSKENRKVKIKFKDIVYKIIFIESESQSFNLEIDEDAIDSYLDLSEKINKVLKKTLKSYNFDSLELSLLSLDEIYQKVPQVYKKNKDIIRTYKEAKLDIQDEIKFMKRMHKEYESNLESITEDIVKNENYQEITKAIKSIKTNFSENIYIKSDSKSFGLKELYLNRLKTIGKTIALINRDTWSEDNFNLAKSIIKEINNEKLKLELKEVISIQEKKLKEAQKELLNIDYSDSKLALEKFIEIKNSSEMFNLFFDKVINHSFDNIIQIIDFLENEPYKIVIPFLNNLKIEKVLPLLTKLPESSKIKLFKEYIPLEKIKNKNNRNIFVEYILINADNEKLEFYMESIKNRYFNSLQIDSLIKVLVSFSEKSVNNNSFVKKISPKLLFEIIESGSFENQSLIKDQLIKTLLRWLPTLKSSDTLFTKIMNNYPEDFVFKVTVKQAQNINADDLYNLIQVLESNKVAIQEIVIKTGSEKIKEVIQKELIEKSENDPNNLENIYNVAISYLSSDRFEDSIEKFNKFLELDPENYEAYTNLGIAYSGLNKIEQAIISYKKAIKLKANHTLAHFGLGSCFLKSKDYPRALNEFKKVLKSEPDNYECHINIGVTYDEMNDIDLAMKSYESAIEIDPNKNLAFFNLAVDLTIKESYEEALEMYKLILDNDSKNSKAHYNLGILYQKLEENNFALAHYKLSIKLEPENSQAYNNAGLIYFTKKNNEKAIKMWKKAIKIDDNIDAYNNLGWVYFALNEVDRALKIYDKAKTIDPKHPSLYLNSGTIYCKKNEQKKAIKELEKYLELEPNNDKSYEVIKIIQDLKKI